MSIPMPQPTSLVSAVNATLVLGSTYTTLELRVGELTRTGFRTERQARMRIPEIGYGLAANEVEVVVGEVMRLLHEVQLQAIRSNSKMVQVD